MCQETFPLDVYTYVCSVREKRVIARLLVTNDEALFVVPVVRARRNAEAAVQTVVGPRSRLLKPSQILKTESPEHESFLNDVDSPYRNTAGGDHENEPRSSPSLSDHLTAVGSDGDVGGGFLKKHDRVIHLHLIPHVYVPVVLSAGFPGLRCPSSVIGPTATQSTACPRPSFPPSTAAERARALPVRARAPRRPAATTTTTTGIRSIHHDRRGCDGQSTVSGAVRCERRRSFRQRR